MNNAMQRPLRVLMTADTVGGVWSYALELIRALAPYRCEFLLATMGEPLSTSQQHELASLENVTVAESAYKLEWMDEPWEQVDESCEWLLQLAHDFRPDLVHLNTFVHGALPWTVPVVMVGHSCVLSWWQAVKGRAAPASWATYRRRVKAGLQRASVVVAPTRAMLNELDAHYGPLRNVQVIYNARSPADYRTGPKENFIFTMGRVWDEAKNISILDQVAHHLPWPIYVAGDMQHPGGKTVQLANLHTLGHLGPEEVRAWLARASIFVLPARYEPFGLAMLEAALSSCTLAVGNIRSLREVWNDAALYLPPHEPEAWQHALAGLIDARTQREELARAARARAKRYAPERMAHAYWRLYLELLNLSSGQRLLTRQKFGRLPAYSRLWQPAPATTSQTGRSR